MDMIYQAPPASGQPDLLLTEAVPSPAALPACHRGDTRQQQRARVRDQMTHATGQIGTPRRDRRGYARALQAPTLRARLFGEGGPLHGAL